MLFCQQGNLTAPDTGESIVFLHGFLGCWQDWKLYLDHFSSLGIKTFAPDLPGHGSSTDYELGQLLSLLPSEPHLVGYSMGGRLALQLQKKYPARFKSLTLISTNPGLRSQAEIDDRKSWEDGVITDLKKQSVEDFIHGWYKQKLFSGFIPPETRFRQNMQGLIDSFRKFSIANLPSLWDYLPQIKVPTQMIFGQADLKYSKLNEEVEKIDTHNRIKTYSVPKCGHSVHVENPSFVFKVVENSIKKVSEHV